MRSKNILPVQVVSSSDLMGSNQSAHKAAFEEALHSSIESSLRSAAVVPSSVFSTLFFTLRQSSSTIPDDQQDVKPNINQLSEEISKHAGSEQTGDESASTGIVPNVTQQLTGPISSQQSPSSGKDVASMFPTPQIRPQVLHADNRSPDGRQLTARPTMPLITQQQHMELQRFKQLQRLRVWQQMQSEQQSKAQPMVRNPSASDVLYTGPNQMAVSNRTQPMSLEMRKPPPPMPPLTSPINGMHGNGTTHTRMSFEGRTERQGSRITGFCKTGKDIRLSTFENDALAMAAFPFTYALLCMQLNPRSGDTTSLVIIALNLKSLPPPNTSAQALSAQCVGCGEKALHTFSQLSDHIGLEATVDLTSPRLSTNSSQLIGAHAQFYLVKDPKVPSRLIRGPPILWNKGLEGQLQSGVPSPRAGMLPVMASPQLLPKPNVGALPPTPRLSGSQHLDSPLQNAIHRLHGQPHPLLGRSMSGPSQRNIPDTLKRLSSNLADDESQDQLQPKRYMINRDVSAFSAVDISPDLAFSIQRKPVIVFLCPTTNLPRFSGDTSNITVTQTFSECFKEPLSSIKEQLDFSDHSPLSNDVLLLITMQYVVSLGAERELSKEGLSHTIVQARQSLPDTFLATVKELKPSSVISLANFFASTSQGRVKMAVSELSSADAITQCLRNLTNPNRPLYQIAVYSASMTANCSLQFHLVVSSKRKCRTISEHLLSTEDQSSLLKQSLVSLPFTQLRLSLSGPFAIHNNVPHRPSSPIFQPFVPRRREPPNHTLPAAQCSALQQYETHLVTSLTSKVLQCQATLSFSLFTSLRFIFLLPRCPALHNQTVSTITHSGVLSDIYKTSLPGSALSSQVVMTMESSSKQRLLSVCKQWEDTSTLLVIIQLEANLTSNNADESDFLNNASVTNSKNVLVVQCTSSPDILLTNRSRIAPSNEVRALPTVRLHSNDNAVDEVDTFPLATIFDPHYEAIKWDLLDNNFMLHTSLVACELMLQQYVGAITREARSDDKNWQVELRRNRLLSPVITRVVQDLIRSSRDGEGAMVVVRIPTSILATRFHDSITETRDKLGLDKTFEVVLYSSCDKEVALSRHFLRILKSWNPDTRDWMPTSLEDIAGIPCIVVYEGEALVNQRIPRGIQHVDLRMVFEGTGDLNCSLIERELSICHPVCYRPANACPRGQSPPKKRQKHSSDDEGQLQVVEHEEDSCTSPPVEKDTEETETCEWEDGGKSIDVTEQGTGRKREREDSSDSTLDFVSLAMKEANLTSSGKGKYTGDVKHTMPTVILPQNIYDLLEGDKKGLPTLSSLPPHPLCTWIDSLHPQLEHDSTPRQKADFYRKWCKPVHGHPDFFDGSLSSSGDTSVPISVHPQRFLLVTSPTTDTARVCCQFLQQLHSSLMKLHEVEVYDDGEDLEEVDCDTTFRTLLPDPQRRKQSQIVNSCDHLEKLSLQDVGSQRNVVTTFNSNVNACSIRTNTQEVSGEIETETRSVILTPSGYKGEIHYQLVIPKKFMLNFIYGRSPSGEVQLRTLRLKCKNDTGIKTPVVSLAHHSVHDGLYNLGNASSSGFKLSDGSEPMHVIMVRHKDSENFKKFCHDSVIVVLPPEFDFLGRGSLKFAAQVLFQHFYDTEVPRQQEPDSIWPFVLLVDDECVSWSEWRSIQIADEFGDDNSNWANKSFGEIVEILEASVNEQFAAVGLRQWTGNMKDPDTMPNVEYVENEADQSGNYFSERVIGFCVMLNLRKTRDVTYNCTRFYNEDVDWSIRAASSGLKVCRLESIAVAIKAIPSSENELINPESSKTLMTAADSEFEPLAFHPHQLLETYFSLNASELFPLSKNEASHPVLCLDGYVSLGPEIFVEFTSSHPLAPSWAIDCSKEYGALMLFCPSSNVKPEFLHEFSFIEGATVCVISNDRSSLRQSVVKLNLERDWHFRLTDEFQTASSETLGGVKIRPLYFLTGVRKTK
uniref:GREB1-like protein n=1 Tax=Phallusia mammillata TaxID=59560 RepID=A0A6F9DFZ7_9ASCI|nr:GREB1-like protein [Phallusia mammillata]